MRQRVQRSQRDHSCVSLAERLLSSGGIPASSAAPSSDADDDDDDDDAGADVDEGSSRSPECVFLCRKMLKIQSTII